MRRTLLILLLAFVLPAVGCGFDAHAKGLEDTTAAFDKYRDTAAADRVRKNKALALALAEIRRIRAEAELLDDLLRDLVREMEESE